MNNHKDNRIFNLLLNLSNSTAITTDHELKIIQISDSFEKIFNETPGKFLNKKISDLITYDSTEILNLNEDTNYSETLTATIEIKDKTYLTKIYFHYQGKENIYIFIIKIDNSIDNLGEQLGRLGIGMMAIAKNKKIIFANNVSLNYFGVDTNKKCNELSENASEEYCQRHCLFNAQGKTQDYESERLIKTTMGYRFFKIITSPVYDISGAVKLLIKIFIDINEVKTVINELKEKNKILEENFKLKNEFISNISHELKTPLTSILGYSELLQKKVNSIDYSTNQDLLKFVETAINSIEKAGKRLLDLITNLLNFSEIELKKAKISTDLIEFDSLINDIKKETDRQLTDKKLEISYNISAKIKMIKFYTDYIKLKNILLNLMANAIKFTEKGAVFIGFDYIATENSLIIKITDTGIGIDSSQLSVIFEPFRQIDGTLTRKYRGVGLGLTLVKKYIELLEGSITVESNINKGSTIIVKLKNLNSK